MADRNLIAAAFFASLLLLALPLSHAVSQPAGEAPRAELYPGESATLTLVYFSDANFPTYLDFSAFGDGSGLLSFEPYLPLPENGVVYLQVKVSVPENFTAPAELHPIMGVIQTQVVDSSSDEVMDSGARQIDIFVKQRSTSSSTSSAATSTGASSNQTPSGTSSNAAAATNVTATAPAASQAVSSNASTATVAAPKSAIISFPDASKAQKRDDEERKAKLSKKAAKLIDKLRGEGKSKKDRYSERHEIVIVSAPPANASAPAQVEAPPSSGVVNVNIDFTRNVSDVGVVVNTLDVEGETTESGVVSAPVDIGGAEDPADRTIEISGVSLPDIQQRTVREEVIRTTPAGEVVRKVTKKKAYKYLEIDLEQASSSDVAAAEIGFEVEKSWLAENGIFYSEVRLNRLVGADWVELETRMVSEGADSYTFAADSPGFSFFVITAAITADVLTPISIEVPTVEEEAGPSDLAGDILGTSKPQPLVILNFSWTLIVVVLGIIVMWKWNDIKRAMGFVHAKENKARELEEEKARYQRMKEETTKKYYKRVIGETEFNNLVVEYDKNIIRIDTELQDMGRKSEKKQN